MVKGKGGVGSVPLVFLKSPFQGSSLGYLSSVGIFTGGAMLSLPA